MPDAHPVRPRALLVGTALLVVYLVAAKSGLRLAYAFPSATPVWPATGVALIAFLVLGTRIWPLIFVGAFIANLTTAGTVLTSLGIATGNTLEGIIGAWLVARYAGGREFLKSAERIFIFTAVAAVLSTAVSATIGVLTLRLGGMVAPGEMGPIWLTWWLGDASGDLIFAPFIMAWIATPFSVPTKERALEGGLLFGGLSFVSLVLFGLIPPLTPVGVSLKFVTIPFLTWAAVRFRPREAATAILLLGVIAVWGTIQGLSSLPRPVANTTLVVLQTYMGVAAVMTLMLAAAVEQQRDAEERLRALSISDPLTGIANYRHLISRLEGEIGRSVRSGRPFSVLFMDVDGLKRINDKHGHITGSRALCRVAEVLSAFARVVDTAARYGGDEFALLLPETTEEEAAQVARRLADRLAASTESPPVQVSIGISVHPRDGATPDALIGSADRRLYEARERSRGPRAHTPLPPTRDPHKQ